MKLKSKCQHCERTKFQIWVFYSVVLTILIVMLYLVYYVHGFEKTCDGCIERGGCVRPVTFTYQPTYTEELEKLEDTSRDLEEQGYG